MSVVSVYAVFADAEEAERIGRTVIEERLAACINILAPVRSIYRWKGKICKDGELLLIVKTLEGEFEGVAATIRELHSYELPEILSFSVSHGERRFLEWIAGSVDKNAIFDDEDEEEEELAYAALDPDED